MQATNRWVRVQGYTNSLAVIVFTPRQELTRQSIITRDLPTANAVHFLDGNRTLSCQLENGQFVFHVLENTLDKKR